MNILPVSEKMKKELAKYFNKETNRYDIGAILNDMPEPEFGNYDHIYAGTDIDDQVVEHDFLSAAHQLNEELESTPETVAVDHDSETEIEIDSIEITIKTNNDGWSVQPVLYIVEGYELDDFDETEIELPNHELIDEEMILYDNGDDFTVEISIDEIRKAIPQWIDRYNAIYNDEYV